MKAIDFYAGILLFILCYYLLIFIYNKNQIVYPAITSTKNTITTNQYVPLEACMDCHISNMKSSYKECGKRHLFPKSKI